MKLFLLSLPDFDGEIICGLYSSKEKAVESIPFQDYELNESNIREIESDPPNGERYEEFFYVTVCSDGKSWSYGPLRIKPSELQSQTNKWDCFSMKNLGNGKEIVRSHSVAKTESEAFSKASLKLNLAHPVQQTPEITMP